MVRWPTWCAHSNAVDLGSPTRWILASIQDLLACHQGRTVRIPPHQRRSGNKGSQLHLSRGTRYPTPSSTPSLFPYIILYRSGPWCKGEGHTSRSDMAISTGHHQTPLQLHPSCVHMALIVSCASIIFPPNPRYLQKKLLFCFYFVFVLLLFCFHFVFILFLYWHFHRMWQSIYLQANSAVPRTTSRRARERTCPTTRSSTSSLTSPPL